MHAKQNVGELINVARTEDITIVKNGRPFVIESNASKEPNLPNVWEAKRKIIQSYFDGKISRTIAMQNGGYDFYLDLLQDAKTLSMPMPLISLSMTDALDLLLIFDPKDRKQ